MAEEQNEVELIGTWASPACARVELALKIKGIPYKYIEEDLKNKSHLLLKHNPVHKKVPILVHNGKPIAESLIILEYIDEHWNNGHKLLPDDPYERAKLRFWANYHDQKLGPGAYFMIMSKDKDQEKAIEDYSELLKVFEEGIERDFPGKLPFLEGDTNTLCYLGVVVGASACNYKVFHEVFGVGVDKQKHSAFFSWVDAMSDCPLMKETIPPHDKLVAKLRQYFSLSP